VDEFLLKMDMPDDARRELVSLGTEKKMSSGDVLFDYHDPAEELFFVQEGSLAVHKSTGFLEKMQVIALLDSGAVIGEAAFLDGHIRNTRVTAIEDSVIFCLKKNALKTFCKDYPASGFVFLEYLFLTVTLRLEKTTERLARIL
jgi:CRP-like cAMP-binding protein